jgi:hypothetical protein
MQIERRRSIQLDRSPLAAAGIVHGYANLRE